MQFFGTDGIRGIANAELKVSDVTQLALSAAKVLSRKPEHGIRKPVAIVGRDTRPSGTMLTAAICAGLCSAGVDVYDVGILPTPGVAQLVSAWEADFGVMISASHNPMPDNGIKFFAAQGTKLSDSAEKEIEKLFFATSSEPSNIVGNDVGRIFYRNDAVSEYFAYFRNIVENADDIPTCSHLTVVVDAANGAASVLAAEILAITGARIIAINTNIDGKNINAHCGSTHIDELRMAVVHNKANLGIAFDGDADRCLAVDEHGKIVDGDAILAIFAIFLADKGKLHKNTVVATVMSNYGLYLALQKRDIDLLTTPVGDRYVLEKISQGGYSLGGEQSGHIILADYAATGDGILTSLFLILLTAVTPLSNLAAVLVPLPQVLLNIPVRNKNSIVAAPEVIAALRQSNDLIAGHGRILLRPSGTEELFRVMVESEDHTQARQIAHDLAKIIAQQWK